MANKVSTELLKDAPTTHAETDTFIPLPAALLRNLGVILNEIDWLTDLAADCASDGQYTLLFVGSPLKIVGGAGSPVNPIVIK